MHEQLRCSINNCMHEQILDEKVLKQYLKQRW